MMAHDITLFIDPHSYHFQGDKLFDSGNAKLNGDNLLAPYVYVRDWFTAHGIRVHTADRLVRGEECSARNVYVSLGIVDQYRELAKRPNVILSGFFAMECPIVEPSIYRTLNHAQHLFRRIFTWSDSASLESFVGGPLRCESYRWPQSYEAVHEEVWGRTERKFLVMINANKLPRIYLQELYTERMRAVEFFSRTDEIDLYGVGWDRPSVRVGKTWVPRTIRRWQENLTAEWDKVRPNPLLTAARRVYRGQAASKAETLGCYTFALCFENMYLKGWITEKIFDCFFAGTIPVYWGATDVADSIPDNCFIDMRRFANYAQLRTFMKALSLNEIAEYKENARKFLKSEKFKPFTKESFLQLFRRMIKEDTGVCL